MRDTQWIEWARTRPQPQEREELLTALTSQQKAHLLEHDYVWVEGVGVLWNPPDGELLRRARFTHGTHFQTQRGDFYIDSEGSAREFSDHRIDPPMLSARPPSLPGNMERYGDFGGSGDLDNAVPRLGDMGRSDDFGSSESLDNAVPRLDAG
jgi:hypothetical protein